MPETPRPGRTIAVVTTLAGAAVAIALVVATLHGDFLADNGRILEFAWGRLLLVDIYAGMALFACWIAWREATGARAAAWIVALLLIGNLIACLYVLGAWWRSGGDGGRFWHGARAGQ
jgi:hypothetical protein